jgi:uncharacterized protein YeaO (DUF488 family)
MTGAATHRSVRTPPRGLNKDALAVTAWLKAVAPIDALCRWVGHEPTRGETFRRPYQAERESNSAALQLLGDALARGGVTLVYSARDAATSSFADR